MMLLIDIDRNKKTGWEGYDYAINRRAPEKGKAILEKCAGRWKWNQAAKIDFQVTGNKIEIKVPKDLIKCDGIIGSFEFKWSDNMQKEGDIMDFYINGDVAPSGRFNYL